MASSRTRLFVSVMLLCVGLVSVLLAPRATAQFGGTSTSFSTSVNYLTIASTSISTSSQTIAVTSVFTSTGTNLTFSNKWDAGQKSTFSCPEAGETPIRFVTLGGELIHIRFAATMAMDFYLVNSAQLDPWYRYLSGLDCTLPQSYQWSSLRVPNQMGWLRTSGFESDVVIGQAGQFVVVMLWTQPTIPSYTIEITGPNLVVEGSTTNTITTNAYRTFEFPSTITVSSTQTSLIAQADYGVPIILGIVLVVAVLGLIGVRKLRSN